MASRLDYERVASIIVEAIYNGDDDTCTKWKVSPRTLRRYRQTADSNEQLAAFVRVKLESYQDDWIGDVASAIREGANFVKRASREADATDPEVIEAVGNALKTLTEAHTIARITNERIRQSRSFMAEVEPPVPEGIGDGSGVIDGEVIDGSHDDTATTAQG